MPNSAQNIKFYYGDSSSVYPPQSIDTNGLYLIKNKGVYAGSETIIDTSLFPSNASPALKYTVKSASSNAVSFTSRSSSTKMQPNTVYIVGSLSGTSFTWQKLNTLSIGNSSLDGDLGVLWNTGVNSQIPNTSSSIGSFSADKTVSTYQILWVAGTNGTSITLPSSVKWKDGVAPDSRDMVNKLCELTIMNGLATINIS